MTASGVSEVSGVSGVTEVGEWEAGASGVDPVV